MNDDATVEKLSKIFVEKRNTFNFAADWSAYISKLGIESFNEVSYHHLGHLINNGHFKKLADPNRTICIPNPWTGNDWLFVSKKFAMKVLTLGYLP